MATILLFGVTGYAGSHLADELVSRGHQVIGVARNVDNVPEGIHARAGSIFDEEFVADVAQGVDQIVVALHAQPTAEGEPKLIEALPALERIAIEQGARLSFVGGAGSLLVAEGGPRLFDTPDFPAEFAPEARSHGEILEALRSTDSSLDWFYVSPAATFGAWNPGERTGTFRIGGDVLLTDANGNSEISGADYAIAYADEIESGAHSRQRLSVAY